MPKNRDVKIFIDGWRELPLDELITKTEERGFATEEQTRRFFWIIRNKADMVVSEGAVKMGVLYSRIGKYANHIRNVKAVVCQPVEKDGRRGYDIFFLDEVDGRLGIARKARAMIEKKILTSLDPKKYPAALRKIRKNRTAEQKRDSRFMSTAAFKLKELAHELAEEPPPLVRKRKYVTLGRMERIWTREKE